MSVAGARTELTQLVGLPGIQPIFVTAARTLKLHERIVHCTANTASGDYTIKLPSVGEAAGLDFTFHATIANAKTVTVQDNGGSTPESEDWADLVLDTDNDSARVWSDGRKWHRDTQEIA